MGGLPDVRASVGSNYYNKDEYREGVEAIEEDEEEFSMAKSKVAGFSFLANDQQSLKLDLQKATGHQSSRVVGSYDVGFLSRFNSKH